jgi:hypothetical protein
MKTNEVSACEGMVAEDEGGKSAWGKRGNERNGYYEVNGGKRTNEKLMRGS